MHEERVKVLEEWQEAHPGEPMPDYFVTAMDLAPEDHVKVQAAIQRWVDSSISKTCNLPAGYTVEQTREIYELLYRSGCKGGTIYRDGSRDVQVLNLKEEDKKTLAEAAKLEPASKALAATPAKVEIEAAPAKAAAVVRESEQPRVRPRPYKRRGYTVSKATPSGTAHITMNEDEENQPFEVFLEIGKAGSDIKAMAEAMGRLMSLILRMASPVSPLERVREIVKQITGIGGARSYGFGKRRVLSLPDAVGQALAENYLNVSYGSEAPGQGAEMGVELDPLALEQKVALQLENAEIHADKKKAAAMHGSSADLCPSCGDSAFVRVEGCHTCYACGYSEC
jgi:ribonucleoside-diphosphate reductase alpha chain